MSLTPHSSQRAGFPRWVPQVRQLKVTYLCLSLAAAVICGFYGLYLYTLFRDAQLNMPQPQIERLTRDLRLFHSQTKRFPKNFNEINDRIWHTRPKPDYGIDGRQARVKNHRYFYTKVNDRQCAIWAIPLGPQSLYASAFFVVLSPDWMRSWKGQAMSDEEIARIPVIPFPHSSPNSSCERCRRAFSA
jgi:hypothetical protein